jgi:hypothetical protein
MNAVFPASQPDGAALWQRLGRTLMDVILHLGAHRTATTTFQNYMRDQMDDLSAEDVAFWGPRRSRKTVFPGLFRSMVATKGRNFARRAEGRVRMMCQQAQARGIRQLLVSDENLLGSCAQNLRLGRLYPAAGDRAARLAPAFGGRVRRIVLSIRSQDIWWASASAMVVARGHAVPSTAQCEAISRNSRSWRDVVTDLACAVPGAEIEVIPFEVHNGRPDQILQLALGADAPADDKLRWLNRSHDVQGLRRMLNDQGSDPDLLPDATGRWQPFSAEQTARLRENYADDMHWLIAGADGLATLTQDTHRTRAETNLPAGAMIKGQGYDQGQLAQSR